MNHEVVEKKLGLLTVLILLVISVGGLIEIVPLIVSGAAKQGNVKIVPRTALEQAGFDVYVREGCYLCHSQQIRPFRSETERYGPYSVAAESQYDHPFQFGSKNVPALTSPVSAAATATTGTVFICTTPVTWSRNEHARVSVVG
jgi:cytochrome c oxidase cbb3-type subunit 2